MKIYKLSFAVALLINSTNAIRLNKSEKSMADMKSEMRDIINLNTQSKIEAISNEYAKI